MLDDYQIDHEEDEYQMNISMENEFEDCGYSPALDECKLSGTDYCEFECFFRKAFL